MINMAEALRDRIIASWRLRSWSYRLLSSPSLNRLPLYRRLYGRRIALRQARGRQYPQVVSVETTNACNAACTMCGHRLMQRRKGRMSWELYRDIISQIKSWPLKTLFLSGFGEPLLDPDLAARVEYANKSGLGPLAIFTNASLLDRARTEELHRAGLKRLHLSLDAASPQTFARLRPGLDYHRTMANIEDLLSLSPRPQVFLQLVIVDQGPEEIRRLMALFQGRVERLLVRQAQDWAGRVKFLASGFSPHLVSHPWWPPCHYLWEQLNIYWDGTVPSCCLDYEAAQPLGGAAGQSLSEIWHGPLLREIREKHNAGRRDHLPLCRRCRYFSVWW